MKFTFSPGSRPLDEYQIKRAIHRGGFGEVYYALSDAGKEVALKLLHNNNEVELRGVRQCLNIKHPNLVTIFDIRHDRDGDPWVIMEYVSGKTLAEVLDEKPNGLSLNEIWEWLPGIVAGMNHMHEMGLVHRDLKPANIYREHGSDGIVKVGDVGLSKLITDSRRDAQTQAVGTVYYMAPEIAKGQYGKEIDVYSLGVILYEMMTGDVPFEGESTGEILMKHLTDEPDLSRLPAQARQVVARALEKDPAKRIPDVNTFLSEFEAATRQMKPDWKPARSAKDQKPSRRFDVTEPRTLYPQSVWTQTEPAQKPAAKNLFKTWGPLAGKIWVVIAILVAIFEPRELGDFMGGSMMFAIFGGFVLTAIHLYRVNILAKRDANGKTPKAIAWDLLKAGGVGWIAILFLISLFSPRDVEDYLGGSAVIGIFALLGVGWYWLHQQYFSLPGVSLRVNIYHFVNRTLIGLAGLWTLLAIVLMSNLRGHDREEFMIGSFLVALPILAAYITYRAWFSRQLKDRDRNNNFEEELEIVESPTNRQHGLRDAEPPDKPPFDSKHPPRRGRRRHQRPMHRVNAYRKGELSPNTFRMIPMHQRMTELTGSLIAAVVSTFFLTLVLSLFTELYKDISLVCFFGGTVLLASSAVLVGGKLLEGTGKDQAIRRLSLALLGVCVGAAVFFLSDFLLVEFPTNTYGKPYGLVNHLGPQPLVNAESQPTLPAYVLFFASLFALRRWYWHSDTFRPGRFKISSVLLTLVVGFAVTTIFTFPQFWGVILAAAISCVVQISAPWTTPEQRVVLRETHDNA